MGNKIAIVLALALGVMSIVLVNRHIDTAKAEFVGDTVLIVVARQRIEKGAEIREQMLAPRRLPMRFLRSSGAHIEWDERSALIGATTRFEVAMGEFVSPRILETTGTSSEGLSIREGYRAYTISLGGESAVAGLLVVGDRVDILGTFQVLAENDGLSNVRTQKSRTMYLLRNVEIKALDQVTNGPIKAGSYGMLTFELSETECLVLEYAQRKGRLKVVKRHPSDHEVKVESKRVEITRDNLSDFIDIVNRQRATKGK